MRTTVAICVLSSLLVGAARPARAGDEGLTAATQAYERMELTGALAQFEALLEEPDITPPREATIRVYLGCIRFTLGERQRADEDFAAALRIVPGVELPADTSPKIAARFEELRRGRSAVRVAGTPATAASPSSGPAVGPPPSAGRLWTWVLGGTGGVAAAAGGTLVLLAAAERRSANRQAWADDAQRLSDRAARRALTGDLLFGTAGALLATAVVLYFVEGQEP